MRINTGKHLHRRTFLKGLGAAISLPLLDAMVPATLGATAPGSSAGAAAAAAKAAMRLAFVYVPNGMMMKDWTPTAAGSAFDYTRILKPIESFRDQTTIITRLGCHQANALGDGGGDHARAGAGFLTGTHAKKTGGSDIRAGISADQLIAQTVGHRTRLRSLEVGLDESRTIGHCDSGFSCAYSNSISWRSATTPAPPEANPRLLFERLFGDVDTSIDDVTRARRAKYRASILDLTRDEAARLTGTLGNSDRRKIDEYLSTIRELEQRVQRAESEGRKVPAGIEIPAGVPTDFEQHAKLIYDLQVLAFQSDVTRISTMAVGREGSTRTYEQIGIPDPHHPLSHHRGNVESIEKLTQINTYHVKLFAYFLNKLANTPDGDGSLLDHSMILYGGGLADSNLHVHDNVPIALIGGGNGTIKGGRHINLDQPQPVANLLLSLMDRMDVHPEKFGDSTGRLEI